MHKLLWVAAPLVLALLAWAWLAWRGRGPSRHGLNVGFSLLLLVYVLTTAGLGIFWVAHQQLPVFDWHYLFGYATVLMLLVHLTFNLRIVVHFLRRKLRRGAPAAMPRTPGAAAAVPRRPLLAVGVGGLAVAAGLGYLLGLRHGRTELRVAEGGTGAAGAAGEDRTGGSTPASAATPPPRPASTSTGRPATAPAAAPAARAWAVVEQFHAFSSHSRAGVLRRAASSDWALAPPPFKAYPGTQRLALPRPRAGQSAAAGAQALDLAALGECLWLSTGVSEVRGGIAFRTSPSSGALFATELYVLALEVHGLAAGLWHYNAESHALHRLPGPAPGASAEGPAALAAFGPLEPPPGCPALIVASAVFARSGHKYGERTYRYVTADLGHTLENLRVAARAVAGLECRLMPRFDDQTTGRALALDAQREGVLALAALAPPRQGDPTPGAPGPATPWTSPVADAFAAQGGRLGLTEAMQLATSLSAPASRASAASAAAGAGAATIAPHTPSSAASPGRSFAVPAAPHRPADAMPAPNAADGLQPLPPARTLQADWPKVIAHRRSVRRFAATAVTRQALADILHAMTSPAPALCQAVRIDLLSAAVEGLPPASWRHAAARGALERRVMHGEALRRRARAAALDQDVIGDAAVVFVLSLDVATLRADPLGAARAYRHGFIEAGLVGERLYLAAGALGLAVCAVGAFYDGEAAALVGIDSGREWVVHFAALGLPG